MVSIWFIQYGKLWVIKAYELSMRQFIYLVVRVLTYSEERISGTVHVGMSLIVTKARTKYNSMISVIDTGIFDSSMFMNTVTWITCNVGCSIISTSFFPIAFGLGICSEICCGTTCYIMILRICSKTLIHSWFPESSAIDTNHESLITLKQCILFSGLAPGITFIMRICAGICSYAIKTT